MKRALYLGTGLLVIDQITKGLAAHFLSGRSLLLTPDWGLVYVVNYGLWIKLSLPSAYIPLLQLLAALLLIIAAGYLLFYQKFYRKSLWSDLAYACLIAGVLGNVFADRLLFGYVRDFILTPIAIANLADVYSNISHSAPQDRDGVNYFSKNPTWTIMSVIPQQPCGEKNDRRNTSICRPLSPVGRQFDAPDGAGRDDQPTSERG